MSLAAAVEAAEGVRAGRERSGVPNVPCDTGSHRLKRVRRDAWPSTHSMLAGRTSRSDSGHFWVARARRTTRGALRKEGSQDVQELTSSVKLWRVGVKER